ncbi:MAG: inorganic phosphate transporter [Clostridia bacterium]|nr:inorganic phosphate transporter [Clostridia bacterium]
MTLIEYFNMIIDKPILLVISLLVLGLMLVNGMTDAPNAIATCISTRTIKPRSAIIMAAIFDSAGVFIMSLISSNVVATMSNLVDYGTNTSFALIALSAGIIGTILWAVFATKLGIPSSESHALIAGITGAAIAINHGFSGVNVDEWKKVIYGLVLSLLIGFILGFVIAKIIRIACKNVNRLKANKVFKRGQIFSGAFMAFMHGAQDGQKFMGIFLLALSFSVAGASQGTMTIPLWLIILCSLTMGIGVSIGGYKIIKTVGLKMVKIEPYEGMSADLAGASCLLLSSVFGLPVSTTHTKTTAIMGVGASKRLSSVNWKIVKNMVISWFLVFPGCGFIGFALTSVLLKFVS